MRRQLLLALLAALLAGAVPAPPAADADADTDGIDIQPANTVDDDDDEPAPPVGASDDPSWIKAGLEAKEAAKRAAQQAPRTRSRAAAPSAPASSAPAAVTAKYVSCSTQKCLAHLGPSSCKVVGVACAPDQIACTGADVAASGQVKSHHTNAKGITEIIRTKCASTLPKRFTIDAMSASSTRVGNGTVLGGRKGGSSAGMVRTTSLRPSKKGAATSLRGFTSFKGSTPVAMKLIQIPIHNSTSTVSTVDHGIDLATHTIVGVESVLQTRALRPCSNTPPKWSPYYVTSNDYMPAATNGDHDSTLYSVSVTKQWVSLLRRTDDKEYDSATVKVLLWYTNQAAP